MTGLGDRLKEARKAKGYTLDDLQEITKIQKRYLAGIENEEFNSMPGSFYVRAFIKQYAEAVGLEADEMLALYKGSESKPEEAEERQITTPTLSRRSSRNTGQLSKIMPKIIVALFIVVIILIMSFLWKYGPSKAPQVELGDQPIQVEDQKKPDSGKQKAPTDEEQKDEDKVDGQTDEADKENEEPDVQQTLEHVSTNGESVMYALSNAEKFQLEIRTSEDSWIAVQDEKKVERTTGARVMTTGESIELDVSDAETVRIRVGRTNSTEIYVNGELLEYTSDRITQNIYIEYKKD